MAPVYIWVKKKDMGPVYIEIKKKRIALDSRG